MKKFKETYSKSEPEKEIKDPFIGGEDLLSSHKSTKTSVAKYDCSIIKFATFVDNKPGEQNKIIRERKIKGGSGFPWYHIVKSKVKLSLSEGNLNSIYEGINELKESTPTKKYDILNKKYSIDFLNSYLEITLPVEFRNLRKEVFTPVTPSFRLGDIELKVIITGNNSVTIFKSNYKGVRIVGGVVLNCVKEPFTTLQMKVAASLLNNYLSESVVQDGEAVLPEFCLCVDLISKKYITAPTREDIWTVNSAIEKAKIEFKKKWETIY